ncbi:gamma-interferon-responsive lysosomal thiol protein-like [Euphorbia lathyris]|uniref:gamma-interferon-responsive lysosomal thiol protein-like n=1 Tax=Euphorbia lathyris TaxID=212925 RepID=UPI00331339B9
MISRTRKLAFSLFIPFTLIFLISPPCYAGKVNLSVYYETLCPACANFIVRNLMTIFNNGLTEIINLRMVPWGNAHITTVNGTVVCQNGFEECKLNTIQACAVNVWHDVNKYYALIYCMEFLVIEGQHQNWQTCFSSLGLSIKPVVDCYNNGTGAKLDNLYGYETAHLNPPQTFMPWVVVNNRPLGNDYNNFTAYVCNTYKGNIIPNACKQNPAAKINLTGEGHPVSYTNSTS